MERRVQANLKKIKPRERLAEHPFGTIKHDWDQGYFLTRKLPNARTETPALAAQVQMWPCPFWITTPKE